MLMDFFVAKVLANSAIEVVVFGVVLTGLAMWGYDVLPAAPIELCLTLALTVFLAFGLGLLFAAIASLVPDAKSVIKILFLPLYFASGVLFPASRLPQDWLELLAWNPVLHLVELSRASGLAHYEPLPQTAVGYPFSVALVATFCGLAMYRLRYLSRVTT